MNEGKSFEVWRAELHAVALAQGYVGFLDTEPETYRDYFDEGVSPADTLEEEVDAARASM